MDLSSVRALKIQLMDPAGWRAVYPLADGRGEARSSSFLPPSFLRARYDRPDRPWPPLDHHSTAACPFALGITGTVGRYQLAVRVPPGIQDRHRMVRAIARAAHSEVDVRWMQAIRPHFRWSRKRIRPLQSGISISHVRSTVGTLGCFVQRDHAPHERLLLSNNHVLALENVAALGDPIVQPAWQDGGRGPQDVIGTLMDYVPLRQEGNRSDAALALLDPAVSWSCQLDSAIGELHGLRAAPIELQQLVYKIGRTTGLTEGRVSAFELDGLSIQYAQRIRRFDGQLEITSTDATPFSLPGDSGAVVVDTDGGGVALLFCGAANQASYATPLADVLSGLRVQLVC